MKGQELQGARLVALLSIVKFRLERDKILELRQLLQ